MRTCTSRRKKNINIIKATKSEALFNKPTTTEREETREREHHLFYQNKINDLSNSHFGLLLALACHKLRAIPCQFLLEYFFYW